MTEQHAADKDALIAELVETVVFYGDPENYHATAFWFDPPCGAFREDFSEDHGDPFYERPMPGAKAREVLRRNLDALLPILDAVDARVTPPGT